MKNVYWQGCPSICLLDGVLCINLIQVLCDSHSLLWIPKDSWYAIKCSNIMSKASNIIGLAYDQEAF